MDISLPSMSLEVPAPPTRASSDEEHQKEGISDPQPTTVEQASQSSNSTPWQEPVDFIAMISLVLEHDVHQLELEASTGIEPQEWQQKNMYISFNLGEGASSFLELHSMREDVQLQNRVLRKGDRVALKRCFVERLDDDDAGLTPQQYEFIKRELRVFCHKTLRDHENVSKLLFVGWESYAPAVALGLELAEYGTLKDVLFDANLQDHGSLAAHLVLDIALGLEALHDVGIVHGDVKTGNILVFAHPQRRIVAKLSDFSDSIYLADNEHSWAPIGGTHTWRAPECYETAKYDQKKTDVYSFGLCALAILAQGIWYKNANKTGLGDCFLQRIYELDGKPQNEIQSQVLSWKQDSNNFVLVSGLEWAKAFTKEDDLANITALFVVAACLWREPEKRHSMHALVSGQLEMLASAGEKQRKDDYVASKNNRDNHSDNMTDRKQKVSESRMARVGDERLRDMHPFFKTRMLRALEKIAAPALDLKFAEIDDNIRTSTDLDYANILTAISQSSQPIMPIEVHKKTISRALEAATQVAESYSIGFGTNYDFYTARKWLAIAARSGRLDHAIYFSVVDDALGHSKFDQPKDVLRELWLLITASGGCVETSRILKDRNQNFYHAARRIRRQRGGILRSSKNPEAMLERIADRLDNEDLHIDYKFPPIGYTILQFAVAFGHQDGTKSILDEGADINTVDWTGSTPIQLAASCGDGEMVDLLLQRGANPCVESSAFKFTTLHFLSFVEDDFLDSIADTIVRDPAQLSSIANRRSVCLENPFQRLSGTPLHWAARKPNERLFLKLLDIHLKFSAKVVDLEEVLESLASTHQSHMLEALIPLVPQLSPNEIPLGPSQLDQLLASCLTDDFGIQHVLIHRANYDLAKMNTLEVLLKAGADPFRLSTAQLNKRKNILEDIVIGDDLDVLLRVISFGLEQGIDIRAIFQDTERFGGRNAFQRAMYCTSWRVFEYLSSSPYVDLKYTSDRGMTALHAAVIGDDPRFVEVLLRLGCDPYARSHDGRTPFQSAIFFKAFKSASRLLQPDACSPERLFATTVESCEPDGYTLFASVLTAAVTNYRHIVNFTSIRFLESVGAFTFVNNVRHGTTILEVIANQYPAIRPDYAAFDRALLEYIISRAPPGALNEHDAYGLTPLHRMVMRGNLAAITTMLNHPTSQGQVDINIETVQAKPTPSDPRIEITSSIPGRTALNLALTRRRRIPDIIKLGGQRELRDWGLRTEAIIEVLQDAGAVLGSESNDGEMMEAAGINVVYPGDDVLGSLLIPVLGQGFRAEVSSHQGAWPLRLQRHSTAAVGELDDNGPEDGHVRNETSPTEGENVSQGEMVPNIESLAIAEDSQSPT